ncbi:hypothetical protein CVT24_009563 [Panaeolus cyanescens]|uniref:M-phase inducer phosphatase n=1 Tax=Panaeolus cyanescens TaxID=181874 RepID=A0A409YA98_9AGAR|nr:hypothetical protein CVT24_009563 [Panaeolus cyanescens]
MYSNNQHSNPVLLPQQPTHRTLVQPRHPPFNHNLDKISGASTSKLSSHPFLDKLVERSTSSISKRSKRHHKSHRSVDMPLFGQSSTHHLQPPAAPTRKKSQRFLKQHDEIEDYLSSDLELSFASNVSLNSPPREQISLPSDSGCVPMDISPAPPKQPNKFAHLTEGLKPMGRPRALTNPRLFGSDLSNSNPSLLPSPQMPPSQQSTGTAQGSKKTQRSALPMEWLTAPKAPEPASPMPASPMDDAMDVDTSYMVDSSPMRPSPPASAAPTVTNFNELFYQTTSPRRSFESPSQPSRRRSLSPDPLRRAADSPVHIESSSPMAPSSPSDARLERLSNGTLGSKLGKPSLQGLGAPSASFMKRPRRPVLSAMLQPTGHKGQIQSAYPILSPLNADSHCTDDESPKGSAPVRRAFSAFLPPSIYTQGEDDEGSSISFDGEGPDMSSPAQAYSRRQQVKTIRRCDGTEDFRPLTGTSAMATRESPSTARFLAPGLPGFGDNEKHGKILPCHRVTEDGLMRIKCETLDDLLDGKFQDKIVDFHIIDCRFDYEYNGGHIPGAVNINTTSQIEELLLGPSLTKPRPSVSGDSQRKTVLVFHCEFSAKRAPTFAKHLRAKDRALNNHAYPKIHYPEVYILEGGYCQYFKHNGNRCEPPAYVTMDDPNHASSRREDLDQFRKAKFGRHKSYAYGEGKGGMMSSVTSGQTQQVQPKRNTVPNGAPHSLSLFSAAASAARSRRSGGPNPLPTSTSSLMTLAEDGNVTADETDTDLGDSPCPPPTKTAGLPAGFKKPTAMKLVSRGIVRSETYGPARMNY